MIIFEKPKSLGQVSDEQLINFDCGALEMNEWLHEKARHNELKGGSRTFVVCTKQGALAGYIALSAGSITRDCLVSRDRYQTPNAIPINLLGRLAVDRQFQGQHLGRAMVLYALEMTIKMSAFTGVYALVVEPLNDKVVHFYKRLGFKYRPDQNVLYFPIRDKNGNLINMR